MNYPDDFDIERFRDEDGTLAAFAWPGGYPILYYTGVGDPFCPACANGANGSLARAEKDADEDTESDLPWVLAFGDIYFEGPPAICSHCGAAIESAYGDPDTNG